MPLKSESLQGMWAGLPVPWDDHDRINEEALRENVRRACRAGAHGVYTHGTTGEFYAQTEEEWRTVVQATVEECRNLRTPVQVGCTALWTGEVIRRAAFAQNVGADAVQIAFPFWLPLTEDQAVQFLGDIGTAVPEMPIILYDTDRSKRPLTLELLRRIQNARIPVIGCKGGRGKEELARFRELAPSIRLFVGEPELAASWEYGARGCYSAFVYACPRFMLRYFDLCERGSEEALQIGQKLQRMIKEYVVPRFAKGMYDTAFDRTFATMTGFLTGSLLQSRAPYDSATQADVEACRAWCAQHLPEFIEEI